VLVTISIRISKQDFKTNDKIEKKRRGKKWKEGSGRKVELKRERDDKIRGLVHLGDLKIILWELITKKLYMIQKNFLFITNIYLLLLS